VITADANVFVYLWDTAAPAKQSTAQTVLAYVRAQSGPVGLQVVGELQHILRRKLRRPPAQAAGAARLLLTFFSNFRASESNADESLALMERGALSYWDAMLVTAARDVGCRIMFSEDMQDGARFGALEIVNPFGPTGSPSARLQALLAP
jgi:predicted nucleic acid-binding protein